ncbi:MAG: hypothetical protein GWN56_05280 [Nitrosopumilaceae archaeon]|nr:hypothetical protein [Nitrosopumilaceae archaeon]
MQKVYRATEYQFLQFNEIIPYSHNSSDVYSPYLVNMVLSIGPQILGMFEIIKRQARVRCADTFGAYRNALNRSCLLSKQGFFLRETRKKKQPFPSRGKPAWWDAYNKAKHKAPLGFNKINLGNTIEALGALFILHHIADVAQTNFNRGPTYDAADFTDSSNWFRVYTDGNYVSYKTKTSKSRTLLEGFDSPVFTMDKRFMPHLKNEKMIKSESYWTQKQ